MKLVTCLRGRIFDVVVDIRRASADFLSWRGVELSGGEMVSLFIPPGFAHGFQPLEDECELLYLHSAAYAPDYEGSINAFDSRIGIEWPLPVACMSEKDRRIPRIGPDYKGIVS